VGDHPDSFLAARIEYGQLRRRLLLFFLCGCVSFVAFGLPLLVAADRLPPWLRTTLGVAAAVTGGVSWIGCMSTWLILLYWKCPRCGKRFILSSGSSFPTNFCKHCRLDLFVKS
jgi:DNA-directed RNA polymerase subunit RPC12/RpoP